MKGKIKTKKIIFGGCALLLIGILLSAIIKK